MEPDFEDVYFDDERAVEDPDYRSYQEGYEPCSMQR